MVLIALLSSFVFVCVCLRYLASIGLCRRCGLVVWMFLICILIILLFVCGAG